MSALSGPNAVGTIGNLGSVGSLPSLRDVEPQRGLTLSTGPEAARKGSFDQTFADVLGEVNQLRQRADHLTEQFAAGQVQDLHDVVLAQQEAAIAFQLVQSVRDKLLQSYQELMRMQV